VAALDAFRAELAPTWPTRPSLELACATDPPAADLLHQIHALRYAEEQAVRRDAIELTSTRRGVEQLASKLLGLY
jgi:hypothetical protein